MPSALFSKFDPKTMRPSESGEFDYQFMHLRSVREAFKRFEESVKNAGGRISEGYVGEVRNVSYLNKDGTPFYLAAVVKINLSTWYNQISFTKGQIDF